MVGLDTLKRGVGSGFKDCGANVIRRRIQMNQSSEEMTSRTSVDYCKIRFARTSSPLDQLNTGFGLHHFGQ